MKELNQNNWLHNNTDQLINVLLFLLKESEHYTRRKVGSRNYTRSSTKY